MGMVELLTREGLITPAAMVALCAVHQLPIALSANEVGGVLEPKLVLEPYAALLARHAGRAE